MSKSEARSLLHQVKEELKDIPHQAWVVLSLSLAIGVLVAVFGAFE